MQQADTDAFGLSIPQRGLWAATLLDPGSNACVTGQYSDIRGAVDVPTFELACRRVIEETEALRLRFGGSFEQPLQWIVPAEKWSLPVVDLSGESDSYSAALRWMHAQHAQPIDVTTEGSAFRWALLKLSTDRFIWSFQVHHLLMDGYSRNSVWRRLEQVYSALARGTSLPASEAGPLRQLFDEEAAYTLSAEFEEHRRYFAALLENPPTRVSLSAKSPVTSRQFRRATVHLTSQVTADLRARKSGASLAQMITAAAGLLLRDASREDDIVLGFAVGARVGDLAHRTPSMLSNVVPLRLCLSTKDSVEEILRRSANAIREAMPHQCYPSQRLRQDLGLSPPEPDAYSVVVNFMPFDQGISFAGYPASTHNLSNGPIADLVIGVFDNREQSELRIDLNGNRELYDDAALRHHLDRLIELITVLMRGPAQQPIEALFASARYSLRLFWEGESADLEVPHLPPLQYPCPTGEELNRLSTSRPLPAALVNRLFALASEWDTTAFDLFLTACFAVLRIYTECDAPLIGVKAPRNNLHTGDGEEGSQRAAMLQLCLNPADSFRHTVVNLARRWRELAALAPIESRSGIHAYDPLASQPPIPFSFSMNEAATERNLPAWAGARRSILALQVDCAETNSTVALEFQRSALDPWMAERLVTHLTSFLWAAVSAPEARLAALSVLSPEERTTLSAWGANPRSIPRGRGVIELFEEVVRAQPDTTAVVCGSLRLTYRELDHKANAIACLLDRSGVARGEYVVVLLPRGVDFVACVLGVLKLGAVYVPLDPDLPLQRRTRLLEILGAWVGLCLDDPAPGDAFNWVRVPQDLPLATTAPPRPPLSDDDAAYVMFTSGSTGVPKGVRVAQRGIIRLVRGQDFITQGTNEVWLQQAPTSFDASTLELWAPLLNGGRCVVFEDRIPTPESLSAVIAREGVNSAWFTASLFNALIDEDPGCLSGLTQILVGGEALSPPHVRRALEQLPHSRLINGYGPTENTTFTCWHTVVPSDVAPGRTVPIGRPIANTTVQILDRDGNGCPIGVPGELVAGGDGVALGYVAAPEDPIQARFVGHPGESGRVHYRTGDRVRWRSDGVLEFLGRFDEQLKINGHRIEPGEIAAVIAEHPAVQQAVVVPQKTRVGDVQLFAYVVPRLGHPAHNLKEQLGHHLTASLPLYMQVSAFRFVEALPLKANGKLDVEALVAATESPAVPARADSDSQPWDAPVLAVISELLGQPVSRHDNLYALGANSLRLVRLVARLKTRLGLDLPIGEISKRGDVRDILSLAAQQDAGEPTTEVVDSCETQAPSLSLCSPWQMSHWLMHQLDPLDASAVVFRVYRCEGAIDAHRLERAVRALSARHDSLRCRFVGAADAEPELEPRPIRELTVHHALPVNESSLTAARIAARAVPFDLRKELPIRITLQPVAQPSEQSELWVAVHHIAFDGASEQIFWRELQTIFANLQAGKAELAGLQPLRCSFIELAQRQRSALDSRTLQSRQKYWQGALDGAPERLPLSWRSTPAVYSNESLQVRRSLNAELGAAVAQLGRKRHISVAMLCLACFQAMLLRWSGTRDQVIAVDFAGRVDVLEEDQIGLFTSPLPLRVQMSDQMSLIELACKDREQLGDGLSQRIPFERLVSALGSGRRRLDGFRIFYGHFSRAEPPLLGATRLVEVPFDSSQTGTDLRLNVEERGEDLSIVLVGATALFDREDLLRLADAFECCLAQFCRDPDCELGRLEWLGESDRARLAEWNSSAADYSRDQPLTKLLAAQAARSPSAIALEAGDIRLTYSQLFERAGRLAARLRQAGVGRNRRVGLYLDRHVTLPECLLAILQAGGGYVPLDPAFPRDRLSFMLRDADVCAIVTRSALLTEIPPNAAPVICVDEDSAPAAAAQDWLPPTAESLAYVLYTSGSTGNPKGVEVEHRQLVNFLTSMASTPGMTPSDRILAVTSMSFDIAGLEIWLPLFCGACICLAGREEVADVRLLQQALARGRVTVLQTTTSTWRALLASGWSGGEDFKALVGGEALPSDLAEQLAARCGEAWNLYGPTETTIWSSAWRLPKPVGMVRVGRPIANTELHVLDEHLRVLPVGVTGELFIGGEGVSRGYLNRPELTAARFPPDPFRGSGARMYRTGDLARWLPDGTLNLLGRTDDQLKVRGHRIEAGEVEAALLSQAGVVQAAAVLHKPPDQDDARLVAYLVLAAGADMPSSSELRARLRLQLPDYMLPYHFVQLPTLPLTPNGKLDRRQLSGLSLDAEVPETAPSEPISALESSLVQHFAHALGRPVSGDTDFFEAGGDSLGVLRIVARLSQEQGVQVSSGELFLHSTPRLLAQRLKQLSAGAARPRHLLLLRRGETREAIVLVHPVGGHLAPYGRLMKHFAAGVTLYGLQSTPDSKGSYAGVRQRCSAYVEEIRAVTSGPLILAGYSLGGVLALEMAEQLRRAGQEVRLVLLIDSAVPRPPRRGWDKVQHRISELRRFSWTDRRIWLTEQLSRHLHLAKDTAPDLNEAEALMDMPAIELLLQQARSWEPPRYPGKVYLIRGNRNLRGYPNPAGTHGWGQHCTDLDVLSLACNHSQILVEPYVMRIAEEIRSLVGECAKVANLQC